MSTLEYALDYLGALARYTWTRDCGVSTIETASGSWTSEDALDAVALAIAEELAFREAIAACKEVEVKA